MKTRIRQAALAAGLLVPLALSALTSPPVVARAQAPAANRFLGPLFPPLVDDGDGIPEEDGSDAGVPITFATASTTNDRITLDCGISSPPDMTLAATNPDATGRFQTLTIDPVSGLFANHTVSTMNSLATKFSYSAPSGSTGTGDPLDANGDGVFDQFRGTGTKSLGDAVDFSVSLVTVDVTGDSKGDYVTLAGGLAALPGHITDVGNGFCQTSAPQVFIPLADCSGDGTPDCIALGTTSPLPQYFKGPTLAGPTLDL